MLKTMFTNYGQPEKVYSPEHDDPRAIELVDKRAEFKSLSSTIANDAYCFLPGTIQILQETAAVIEFEITMLEKELSIAGIEFAPA